MAEAKVLVPAGMLGAGFTAESVDRGIALGADAIAVDGGSTDSGPYYLGLGLAEDAARGHRRRPAHHARAGRRRRHPRDRRVGRHQRHRHRGRLGRRASSRTSPRRRG